MIDVPPTIPLPTCDICRKAVDECDLDRDTHADEVVVVVRCHGQEERARHNAEGVVHLPKARLAELIVPGRAFVGPSA